MMRSSLLRPVALALAGHFLGPFGCATASAKARPGARAETGRTRIERGVNLFSREDDVELGREAAAEAEKELVLLDDPVLGAWVEQVGKRVAAVSMEPGYPYRFRIVDSAEINAFALPGGFIYLNRGILERAESEAEVAGVLAHEVGHAAARHGTNQVTKQLLISVPLALVTGLVIKDDSGWKGGLARLGIELGATGLFLSYSRKAESQADILATQALYDSGYDPTAMATFFAKLREEQGRSPGKLERFFSSHPVPENREKRVQEEVRRLGPARLPHRDDPLGFARVKQRLAELPPAPEAGKGKGRKKAGGGSASRREPVPAPASRWTGFATEDGRIEGLIPANWTVRATDRDEYVLAPEAGFDPRSGNLTHGLRVCLGGCELEADAAGLDAALDAALALVAGRNPGFRERRGSRARVELDREEAARTILTGPDGAGGEEVAALLVRPARDSRRGGWIVVHAVVPAAAEDEWAPAIDRVLGSLRFP